MPGGPAGTDPPSFVAGFLWFTLGPSQLRQPPRDGLFSSGSAGLLALGRGRSALGGRAPEAVRQCCSAVLSGALDQRQAAPTRAPRAGEAVRQRPPPRPPGGPARRRCPPPLPRVARA